MGQGTFLAGAAVIVLPSPVNVAVLGVWAGGQVLAALRDRRKQAKGGGKISSNALFKNADGALDWSGKVSSAVIEWEDLNVVMQKKDGSKKQLLSGLSGRASPGR
jgi:hypothetical protein